MASVAPTKAEAEAGKEHGKAERIVSIDALRGFTMFWIIGGDGIAWSLAEISQGQSSPMAAVARWLGKQFTHVQWEGFRFYDFIFPLFIFTTGVTIVLSLKHLSEREGIVAASRRVLRRASLLFALGVIYYGGVSVAWPDIRLLGVLQRIGVCYLVAAILFLTVSTRALVVALSAILLGYWALLTFVPVPGVGAPSYGPDANLVMWIDQNYLPGKKWYGTWDPEGLLSTVPAIGTCLMGVLAGCFLMTGGTNAQAKSMWLVISGALLTAVGYAWGLQFPVIKNLWTSSFVLVAGGWSLILLGALYQVIDVWLIHRWSTIFVWIGANAISLYFLQNVASFDKFALRLVGGDVATFLDRFIAPGAGKLLGYVTGLGIAVAIARFFYQRKIFLRV